LAIILLIVLLGCLLQDKNRSRFSLVILFALSSAVNVSVAIVVFAQNFRDEGSAFCASNAVPYSPKDPSDEHYSDNSVCPAQSVVLLFTLLFNCLCWVFLTLDVFLKYVYGINIFESGAMRARAFTFVCFCILLVLPMISVAIQTGTKQYGYQIPLTFCLNQYSLGDSSSRLPEREYFYKPLAFYTACGVALLIGIFGTALYRMNKRSANYDVSNSNDNVGAAHRYNADPDNNNDENAGKSGSGDLSKMSKHMAPLIFCTLMMVLWISIVALKFNAYHNHFAKVQRVVSEVKKLTQCIFSVYDGTDASWESVCGDEIPNADLFLKQTQWVRFCIFGQGIIVAVIYLPAYACKSCFYDERAEESFRKNQVACDVEIATAQPASPGPGATVSLAPAAIIAGSAVIGAPSGSATYNKAEGNWQGPPVAIANTIGAAVSTGVVCVEANGISTQLAAANGTDVGGTIQNISFT
jgi:hypothetical protein